MDNITIRNARDGDFLACITLSREAWPQFKERESIYHLFCKFFSSTSFVAERADGVLAGFLLGFLSQVDDREAYIHLVVVDGSARRQGMASRLYAAFFEAAAQATGTRRGAERVRLIVNPDNAASLQFHERMGFVPDTPGPTILLDGVVAVKDYNGPGIHMVPCVRAL